MFFFPETFEVNCADTSLSSLYPEDALENVSWEYSLPRSFEVKQNKKRKVYCKCLLGSRKNVDNIHSNFHSNIPREITMSSRRYTIS